MVASSTVFSLDNGDPSLAICLPLPWRLNYPKAKGAQQAKHGENLVVTGVILFGLLAKEINLSSGYSSQVTNSCA